MSCSIALPHSEISLFYSNGKVILSKDFLLSSISPLRFHELHAVIAIGSEEIYVPLQPTANHLGEAVYILEECLSSKYIVKTVAEGDASVVMEGNPSGSQQHMCAEIDVSPPHCASSFVDLTTPTPEDARKRSHAVDEIQAPGKESVVSLLQTGEKRNTITKLLVDIPIIERVTEIPKAYNGNIAFEFSLTLRKLHAMDAMEHVRSAPVDEAPNLQHCFPWSVSSKSVRGSFKVCQRTMPQASKLWGGKHVTFSW